LLFSLHRASFFGLPFRHSHSGCKIAELEPAWQHWQPGGTPLDQSPVGFRQSPGRQRGRPTFCGEHTNREASPLARKDELVSSTDS